METPALLKVLVGGAYNGINNDIIPFDCPFGRFAYAAYPAEASINEIVIVQVDGNSHTSPRLVGVHKLNVGDPSISSGDAVYVTSAWMSPSGTHVVFNLVFATGM